MEGRGEIDNAWVPVAQAGTAVDVVFMLYGTLSHLISNDDALATFAAAAASLAPKGTFVVEMQHPTDLFDGVLACGDTWEVNQSNRLRTNALATACCSLAFCRQLL
jgi:hypothetical protein